MAEQQNKLVKAEKLKSRKQIQALFTKGNSLFIHPVKTNWMLNTVTPEGAEAPQVQIGVSVSKRYFKKAVERNRIKRLLREAYRLNKIHFLSLLGGKPMQLQVFFIYVDKTLPTFDLVQEKMRLCMKRLADKIKAS